MLETCNPGENRAAFADWVELKALSSPHGECKSSELIRSLSLLSESSGHGDVELEFDVLFVPDNEDMDLEIIDGDAEETSDIAHSEIRHRASTLGDLYPFILDEDRYGWTLRRRSDTEIPSRAALAAHLCYSVCLLASGMRSSPLKSVAGGSIKIEMEKIFQRIAWLNARSILGGDSFWIGFPRPEKTGLLTAMQDLASNMGLGKVHKKWPQGVTWSAKDGGLDVIAWRRFRDNRAGGIVLLIQVASGENWTGKSAKATTSIFKAFWRTQPSSNLIPAMFIPFVQHVIVSEHEPSDHETFAWAHAYRQEEDFGLIVDRLRLTELTADTFESEPRHAQLLKDALPALKWFRDARFLART